MRKLLLAVAVVLLLLFLIKRNNMTWRQSILKTVYPLIMLKGKLFPNKTDALVNKAKAKPAVSFYDLKANTNDGQVFDFQTLKGKKVLIVNTASDCGYTGQYEELEKLHQQYKELVVIGFPANDFKQQEKKDDAAIAAFCKKNYGVSFLLMQKTQVVKGAGQHPVYQWLTDAGKNGWCSQAPVWNFSKYVVDEEGVLTHFFSQNISPLSNKMIATIQ